MDDEQDDILGECDWIGDPRFLQPWETVEQALERVKRDGVTIEPGQPRVFPPDFR